MDAALHTPGTGAPARVRWVYPSCSEWAKPGRQPCSQDAVWEGSVSDVHAPTVSSWLKDVTEVGPCPISKQNKCSSARSWHTCWHPEEGLGRTNHSLAVFEEAGLPAWWTRQDLSSAATRRTARALCPHGPATGPGAGVPYRVHFPLYLGGPAGGGWKRVWTCLHRTTDNCPLKSQSPCSQPSERRL